MNEGIQVEKSALAPLLHSAVVLAAIDEAQGWFEAKPMLVIAAQDVLQLVACRRLGILVGWRRLAPLAVVV